MSYLLLVFEPPDLELARLNNIHVGRLFVISTLFTTRFSCCTLLGVYECVFEAFSWVWYL